MQYTQLSRRSAGGKIDWEKQYLTFIPVEDAVFSWAERAVSGHLEYSVNGGQTWVTIANGESTPTVTAGSKVIWRGDLRPTYSTSGVTNSSGIGTFSATGSYNAYGNTMSLLFYDNYYGSNFTGITFSAAFAALFYQDTHILTAPLLPAKTLRTGCYFASFRGCSNLRIAQAELPATNLVGSCYYNMYRDCASLVKSPTLRATITAYRSCRQMFYGCNSLAEASDLLSPVLDRECYYQMFVNCNKLNYIKCLATDISASDCTYLWLSGASPTGTFVKAAGMTGWSTGTSGIPEGWTVVDDNS